MIILQKQSNLFKTFTFKPEKEGWCKPRIWRPLRQLLNASMTNKSAETQNE